MIRMDKFTGPKRVKLNQNPQNEEVQGCHGKRKNLVNEIFSWSRKRQGILWMTREA